MIEIGVDMVETEIRVVDIGHLSWAEREKEETTIGKIGIAGE